MDFNNQVVFALLPRQLHYNRLRANFNTHISNPDTIPFPTSLFVFKEVEPSNLNFQAYYCLQSYEVGNDEVP